MHIIYGFDFLVLYQKDEFPTIRSGPVSFGGNPVMRLDKVVVNLGKSVFRVYAHAC